MNKIIWGFFSTTGVYAVGFLSMGPQLFVNYKVCSQIRWRPMNVICLHIFWMSSTCFVLLYRWNQLPSSRCQCYSSKWVIPSYWNQNMNLKCLGLIILLKFISLYSQGLNTFVSDIFSGVLTTPGPHPLACFRDDVIFLIYLYQRRYSTVTIIVPY